ncbi:MAG: hypothetical protein KAS32_31515, partial [Candidatus Peribacteraceae bacterium]|nr:hypothetical protein [Candidatus Peribacteraceae bacterium]
MKMREDANFYSVSRMQPSGFTYEDLPFLAARDISGRKLSLKESGTDGYKQMLYDFYDSVMDTEIKPWVESLNPSNIDVLCCWCPFSESTRNQIKEHGTFVCHTGLIGKMVHEMRPEIEIYMDMDRHHRL